MTTNRVADLNKPKILHSKTSTGRFRNRPWTMQIVEYWNESGYFAGIDPICLFLNSVCSRSHTQVAKLQAKSEVLPQFRCPRRSNGRHQQARLLVGLSIQNHSSHIVAAVRAYHVSRNGRAAFGAICQLLRPLGVMRTTFSGSRVGMFSLGNCHGCSASKKPKSGESTMLRKQPLTCQRPIPFENRGF